MIRLQAISILATATAIVLRSVFAKQISWQSIAILLLQQDLQQSSADKSNHVTATGKIRVEHRRNMYAGTSSAPGN